VALLLHLPLTCWLLLLLLTWRQQQQQQLLLLPQAAPLLTTKRSGLLGRDQARECQLCEHAALANLQAAATAVHSRG
jgi:hypothetical protein